MARLTADVVAIDTNVLIYYLDGDGDQRQAWVERELFGASDAGEAPSRRVVFSTVGLAEVLTGVARRFPGESLEPYEVALAGLPGLAILPVDRDVARTAARIRGRFGLRLPDAIHVATAVVAGAGAFLTNDRELVRDGLDVPVLVLDDLVD